MQTTELSEMADELSAQGYDGTHLRELQEELDSLDRPPGLLTRMTSAAKNVASKHWQAFVGELGESREAMSIVASRIKGQDITAEERDKVRAQLMDLVRVFPAGMIAAANSAFPVPGTGIFTPWILSRLGLMPSRWREAHLLDQLREERDKLRAAGRRQAADALDRLRDRIEHECDEREHIAEDANLLTHWDANNNGEWDPEERATYRRELDRVRGLAKRFATRKHWFMETEGEIFGALRLSELIDDPDCAGHLHDDEVLVCYEGKTGWVALPDLLGREPQFSR